jgi:hypothetical protein
MENNNEFPAFWFEGNMWSGEVKSRDDLQKVFDAYARSEAGNWTQDEVLDESRSAIAGQEPVHVVRNYDLPSYGVRREHGGDKTLREFLAENGITF